MVAICLASRVLPICCVPWVIPVSYTHLVAEAVRPHNVWVRVLYLQPEGMTDELIETIRDTPEVMPYIDIPVQHCDCLLYTSCREFRTQRKALNVLSVLRRTVEQQT